MISSQPTCSDDKYTRRINRIENAIETISRVVERSDRAYYLRSLREDGDQVKVQVRSNVLIAETALQELKDLLEDDKQEERK